MRSSGTVSMCRSEGFDEVSVVRDRGRRSADASQ